MTAIVRWIDPEGEYLVKCDRLKIHDYEVTTSIELAYWIEQLWSYSYEDIEVWEKIEITRVLCEKFANNLNLMS